MKIATYNVNGIRSALSKGLLDWIKYESPDVLCLQEIKADHSAIDKALFEYIGYKSYWHPAEKKGYSGVAILCKSEPLHVEIGSGDASIDIEGRIIRADFKECSVMSVYIPSGSSGDDRQNYKMQWLDFFSDYTAALRKKHSKLALCGDFNICHRPIDIHDPLGNKKSSGFLPEEREWMDAFLQNGWIDSFRTLNPAPHQYTWWSYRAGARSKNKGWRIDYIMLSEALGVSLRQSAILPHAVQSDHCPMWSIIK